MNSKYADFFDELCEVASRHAAGITPTDPIDYDFINEALICNYSWLNHLTSSSYLKFSSLEDFFEFSYSLCASLREFSDVPEKTLRQQCLRGVGIGLYNLTKDPGLAASYCLNLPDLFDPDNCIEGVFVEARYNALKQRFYNLDNSPIIDKVCNGVDPMFYGSCLRIFAVEILQDYSITEFKDFCLGLGSDFAEACAVGIGQAAFLSFSFTDLDSLALVCDSSLSSLCFERFFFSHAKLPSSEYDLLYNKCLEFVELRENRASFTAKSSDSCDKVKTFIDQVASGYQVAPADAARRDR
jgi:hypothetical protein